MGDRLERNETEKRRKNRRKIGDGKMLAKTSTEAEPAGGKGPPEQGGRQGSMSAAGPSEPP